MGKRGHSGRPPKEPSFHPEAAFYPLIEGTEFSELIEDIKKNGLIEPIVLLDGQIIDGRNRYRACVEAGITPSYVRKTIKNPTEYVLSRNHYRRHLTPDDRRKLATC